MFGVWCLVRSLGLSSKGFKVVCRNGIVLVNGGGGLGGVFGYAFKARFGGGASAGARA